MNETLTIRLPKVLKRDLEKLCKQENMQLSDAVRESVRKYLLTNRFRKLRSKVLPFAEAAGILTDDDVFKVLS